MAQKVVTVSDITGKDIQQDDAVVIVVREHPEIDHPVKLDAGYSEVAPLRKDAPVLVHVEVIRKGQEPEKMLINMSAFERVIRSDVIAGAEAAPQTTVRAHSNGPRINYATIEHAGSKHRGVVTDAEAKVVRENLDAINERLAANGERTIDPTDADMQKRYGFTAEGDAE